MSEQLLELIRTLKKDRQILSFSEEAIKQAVVLRILSALGWDPFDVNEVYPEFSVVYGGTVDYALRVNGKSKVFIEVKKISENLEKHQEKLLNYSFHDRVKLAVLTNGISWWFYLPIRAGSWDQRKFYTIEIYDQVADDIAENFEKFLSKENVVTDKAIENAENVYRSKQKEYMIRDTLPKAWTKILTDPDFRLVELLADTTEKLCGYRPEAEHVEKFLRNLNNSNRSSPPAKSISPRRPQIHNINTKPPEIKDYTGKSIVAFTFDGVRYPVHTWKEMLLKICEIMAKKHSAEFEKILTLHGHTRQYFSKNPAELTMPSKIRGTRVFAEVNLSAQSIVNISLKVLNIFGYSNSELKIETRD